MEGSLPVSHNLYTQVPPKVGRGGELVAYFTCLAGLVLHRDQTDMDVSFLAVNSTSNYEHLCLLNVQGLTDTLDRDQQEVHKEFRDS